ncbi:MAG: hypothetical protein JWR19_945 [Pedosphaera sp.]|nr:hypothetical protein [Pedosphaera sp.]
MVLLLASLCGASAQVTVQVVTDQEQFLPGEALPVAVRIANRSGQTIHLGKDADWLTFSVESADGSVVLKTGEVPVIQEFDLDSSKTATKRVDIAPYFNISKYGRYTVTAVVNIKDWSAQVTSDPKNFDVVRGTKLWEQEFGLPRASAADHEQPEVRKYILQQATYSKHMKLYLRLTDGPESQVFRIVPIGPMVSFSRPESQLDRLSNLHVIYQFGSRIFLYTKITPYGEVALRQTYDYGTSRPRLTVDNSGAVIVTGGMRHNTDSDIPPTGELLSTDVVKPPQP